MNFNKNNVVQTKLWRHLLRFVYSMHCSVWESFTPWAGRSIGAARSERKLLAFRKSKSKCQRLVQWRAYRWPTSGMTATSRNASEVFSPGTALHWCC